MSKDERTNCEVIVAPNIIFGAGVKLETIIETIRDKSAGMPQPLNRAVKESFQSELKVGGWFLSDSEQSYFYSIEEEQHARKILESCPWLKLSPALIGPEA